MPSVHDILHVAMNPERCFDVNRHVNTNTWERYDPPQNWLDELAELFFVQNKDIVKWAADSPDKNDIKQAILKHIDEGNNTYVAQSIRAKLTLIYAVITEKLQTQNINYHKNDGPLIVQNILEGLVNCSEGVSERLEHICYKLTLADNITDFLHALRIDIVEKVARAHFTDDEIYSGNEVHERSEYYAIANAMGYGVDIISTSNAEDYTAHIEERLKEGFKHGYRPLLIQQFIEERFQLKLRESFNYTGKLSDGGYSVTDATEFQNYFNGFFGKSPCSNSNDNEHGEYNFHCYFEISQHNNVILDINWNYVRKIIMQCLIERGILNGNVSDILDVNNKQELEYWLSIVDVDGFNTAYSKCSELESRIYFLIESGKYAKQANREMLSLINNKQLQLFNAYIVAEKVASFFANKIPHLFTVLLSQTNSAEVFKILNRRTADGKTLAMIVFDYANNSEINKFINGIMAKLSENEQQQLLRTERTYSGVFARLFSEKQTVWLNLISNKDFVKILPLVTRYSVPNDFRDRVGQVVANSSLYENINNHENLRSLIILKQKLNCDYIGAVKEVFPIVGDFPIEACEVLLKTISELHVQGKELFEIITSSDSNGNNVLMNSVMQNSLTVKQLIAGFGRYVSQEDEAQLLYKNLLTNINSNGCNVLMLAAKKSVSHFMSVLSIIDNIIRIEHKDGILKILLTAKDYNYRNVLILATQESGLHVEALLSAIDNIADIEQKKELLTNMLTAKDYNGSNALIYAARYNNSQAISSLLGNGKVKFLFQKELLLKECLTSKNVGNWNVLLIALNHNPVLVPSILSAIEDFPSQKEKEDLLSEILSSVPVNGLNAVFLSMRKESSLVGLLFNTIEKIFSQERKMQILLELLTHTLNTGENVLLAALRYNPSQVEPILSAVDKFSCPVKKQQLLCELLTGKDRNNEDAVKYATSNSISNALLLKEINKLDDNYWLNFAPENLYDAITLQLKSGEGSEENAAHARLKRAIDPTTDLGKFFNKQRGISLFNSNPVRKNLLELFSNYELSNRNRPQ